MLSQLNVLTRRGTSLTLDMFENDSGYQIADIDGLDPVKAVLVSTGYAGMDGEEYQSASRGPRNIKVKLDLQPDGEQTFTSLRKALHSYFMTKSTVRLRFTMTSGLYVDIMGVVEDHSSPMFDEDPEVDISLMCFKPDFVDPRAIELDLTTVAGSTNTPINYPGNVEAGIYLTLNINRTLPAFTIYNQGEDGRLQQLDFAGDLVAGDVLNINTIPGNKSITRTRSGSTVSLLYGKPAQSSWILF